MAQQTINVGTSPNDGTGTPLRTAFQYTNSNFSELYTAVGPSGNNIVVPGTATITGDLTVDTNTLKVDSANNRVGIGTATPGYPLHVSATDSEIVIQDSNTPVGSNPASLLSFWGSASRAGYIGYPSDNNLYINQVANSSILFLTNNTEQMRLNSTGLGVGASPTAKLHVSGTGTQTLRVETLTSGNPTLNLLASGQDTCSILYDRSNNYMRFDVSSTTGALILSRDGNVGVGVTPSAWAAYKAVQIGRGSFSSDTSSGTAISTLFGTNFVYDGNWKYIVSAAATFFQQANGAYYWFNEAGTKTAGNTFTPVQAMTLDASGNLLVGTTSAAGSVSNTTKTVGGVFSSINGTTASTASGSAVTLFAAPSESSYLLSAYLFSAGSASAYHVVAIVKVNNGNVAITAISSATGISISSSGLNIQATQTSGISQAVSWNVVRLS